MQWGGINTDSLNAGIYTLFIIDSLGCIFVEDFLVQENPDVNLNETVYRPSCNGDSDASISINISGGTGNPSSFNWSWLNVPAGTVDSVYSLTEGMYFIEIFDSLGCNFLDSIYVDEPDVLNVGFGGFTNPLICNGSETITLITTWICSS